MTKGKRTLVNMLKLKENFYNLIMNEIFTKYLRSGVQILILFNLDLEIL